MFFAVEVFILLQNKDVQRLFGDLLRQAFMICDTNMVMVVGKCNGDGAQAAEKYVASLVGATNDDRPG